MAVAAVVRSRKRWNNRKDDVDIQVTTGGGLIMMVVVVRKCTYGFLRQLR